ncbi:DUF2326 domain-containing protein [Rathayibacter sp. Leaf296]|uniref:DUF2326 domain-containing protein n=1 Tax=Rathayibacter sp. Leaf296 TaxID=1736327 RepID=UPI00138F4A37|nr:DUF2326 domain-containing protein [Rathayibacter sp. Leaf296]
MSVILAEIRIPENRDLDTHNLGKTTVGELIDYCLLKGKAGFFLHKAENEPVFADFVFYLEIRLLDESYLTIARPVSPGSRVFLLRNGEHVEDAAGIPLETWTHANLPLERAKFILDGIFGFHTLSPWSYRKLVGYLIRSQVDYLDVFQLGKFSGKHQDWKPFVAHLLGLSVGPVRDLYAKREALAEAESLLGTLSAEWNGAELDPSTLDGLISVKRREIQTRETELSSFNFEHSDRRVSREVVEDLEVMIARLNEERYGLSQLEVGITKSLDSAAIMFKTQDAEKLFAEAGVLFPSQLKASFDQLIAFNLAISRERRDALEQQLHETRERLAHIELELPKLQQERADGLAHLRQSEAIEKYKDLSRVVAKLQSELDGLESRRSAAGRLVELRREQRQLAEDFGRLQGMVEDEIDRLSQDDSSRFGQIRTFFGEIVSEVLGQNAIISMKLNGAGGIDFRAEFIGEDGTATSEDRGTSYKKLLCLAFDFALLRAYINEPFPRFLFHDGAFEQLETRKKANLANVLRRYAALGIQPIVTSLDSDVSSLGDFGAKSLTSKEIVRVLHDEGEAGRLFNMPSW